MRKFLKIAGISVPGILVVALIAAAILGPSTARRSFPKIDGDIQAAGLNDAVSIVRDQLGIPHIYASTTHDLFFAQGYTHAQDRFWQMDFWRHIGSGRLSEMFGESQLDTDKFLRTLGWARVVQQELQSLDPQSLSILDAYSAGVNAYLAEHQGSSVSLEYAILNLLNPKYQIESWTPLHSMTWAKAMAWDLRGNMEEEIDRAMLLKTLTPEQVSDLYPPYPSDHPIIVPDPAVSSAAVFSSASISDSITRQTAELLQQIAGHSQLLEELLGPSGPGIGSNSWAISGQRTSSGMPLLANDPHLGIQMPSIWYEVGLHCTQKGEACPFDVAGFSFAGVPGVVIGHNDRIAWGMTNVGPDVMDLYIEKINPDNPDQYEVNGTWVDMQVVDETIQIGGGEPIQMRVRYTRHGPLVSDVSESMGKFNENSGLEIPAQFAVALRWTALEPGNTFPAIWRMNQAQNFEEFRYATSFFDVPSQNLIYADVDGNIGYQMPGKIPIRAGGDGMLPVPGWTDAYEWSGYIPFEDLPYAFNPPQGYIVTANNAVVGAEYPNLITKEWDYGYRAERIVELIESAPGPIDIATIQTIQGDNKDLNAEVWVPVLMGLQLEDAHLEQARGLLQGWDYQARMDSAPAALFEVFWKNLLTATFSDQLPEEFWPGGGSRWVEIMRKLVAEPENAWWDDITTTGQQETRDEIMKQAFAAALAEIEKLSGKDPAKWQWGELHTATFRNATLGKSGIGPIEALFNRGPYLSSGGESIINATGWTATADNPYEVDWLPSMRMIVDLGNLQNSVTMHTTGQSGHAYHPHYVDMADSWRNILYHPMHWERMAIEAVAEGSLRLAP